MRIKVIVPAPHIVCLKGYPNRSCDLRAKDLYWALADAAKLFYDVTFDFMPGDINRLELDLNRYAARDYAYRTDLRNNIRSSSKSYDRVIVIEAHSFIDNGPIGKDILNVLDSNGKPTSESYSLVILTQPCATQSQCAAEFADHESTVLNRRIGANQSKREFDIGLEIAEMRLPNVMSYLCELNESVDKMPNDDLNRFVKDFLDFLINRCAHKPISPCAILPNEPTNESSTSFITINSTISDPEFTDTIVGTTGIGNIADSYESPTSLVADLIGGATNIANTTNQESEPYSIPKLLKILGIVIVVVLTILMVSVVVRYILARSYYS